MLEIYVRCVTGLRTERSLNSDGCLSKLKAAVWTNHLVEGRSSNILQEEVQGSGAVIVSPVVSSSSVKDIWKLQGFIVQHCDHTCLERLTEVFRLLMIGAARGMCSGSVMPWGKSGPCSESLGLCPSCFEVARIVHSTAKSQNLHGWLWEQQHMPCLGFRGSQGVPVSQKTGQ